MYLQRVKDIYDKKHNIMQYLREIDGREDNTIEDILISYDFQSGSYIEGFAKNREFYNKYSLALAKQIESLGRISSIIEVGVGEAITLGSLIKQMKNPPCNILGFDLSWSRLKFAQGFLKDFGIENVTLFTANLFEIPLLDNSIDLVYTSHSIEPNGGREEEALRELYRITKKYLVLLEPSYEFADTECRERMKKMDM